MPRNGYTVEFLFLGLVSGAVREQSGIGVEATADDRKPSFTHPLPGQFLGKLRER